MNMTVDPNLNAEVFRNVGKNVNGDHVNKINDFLAISDDNTILLCANDLVGRQQYSFLSLYESPVELLESKPFTVLEEDITTSTAVFINSSLIFVAEDSGMIKLCTTRSFDGKNSRLITVSKTAAHQDIILSAAILTNSKNCVTAGNDLEIKVWDTNYLQDQFLSIQSFYPAHRDSINGLTVHPGDPNVFSSCSADRTGLLWDLRKRTPAVGLFKSEHSLKCIAWQPDSTIIAFGDTDGTVMLLDIRCPGTVFKKIHSFSTELHSIQFCPTSPKLLAMCADTSNIKVLDIEKDNPDCTVYEADLHSEIVRGLVWNRNAKTLYTCGYDSKIIQHDIN